MPFIRLPEVLKLTALSRSSLYRKVREGTFPQSANIGIRSVAWEKDEVLSWIRSRMEERGSSDKE